MKKVAKIFLIILTVLVVVGAVALMGVNLYIQSAGPQAQIEDRLSRALHLPLKITSASVTPWSGLRLSGITIPESAAPNSGNFLDASAFGVKVKLLPLLAGKLEVKEVSVIKPTVVWMQNANGKWRLPQIQNERPETDPVERDPQSVKVHAAREFEFSAERLQMSGGSFDFRGNDHKRIAMLSDVELNCPVVTPEKISGHATSAKTSIQDVVFPTRLRSDLIYGEGKLTLADLRADVAGGELRGNFEMKTGELDSPYVADVTFNGVDLNRLISEAGGKTGQVSGLMSGFLDLYGTTRDTQTTGGSGQIVVTNGEFQQEVFQMLGQILQVDELAHLKLQRAQADFRVVGDKIEVDQLVMKSPNLMLAAHGTVQFDGKMNLEARLMVDETMRRRLGLIADSFTAGDDPNMRGIDFAVTGTFTKPHTNLLEKVVSNKIGKQATDFIHNFLGGGKKEEKKKKPKATPSPEVATPPPAATPLPAATPAAAVPPAAPPEPE